MWVFLVTSFWPLLLVLVTSSIITWIALLGELSSLPSLLRCSLTFCSLSLYLPSSKCGSFPRTTKMTACTHSDKVRLTALVMVSCSRSPSWSYSRIISSPGRSLKKIGEIFWSLSHGQRTCCCVSAFLKLSFYLLQVSLFHCVFYGGFHSSVDVECPICSDL